LTVKKNNDAVLVTSVTSTTKNKFMHKVKKHCHKSLMNWYQKWWKWKMNYKVQESAKTNKH